MLAKEKARRQHELTENIYHLSKALLEPDEEKEEVASKLRLLYQGGFRHNYSDFFPIILEIARQDNDYSIDYLSENLESLRVFVENDYVSNNKRYTSLYPILEKLCDHLNLEISRWSYYSQNEHRIEDISSKTDSMTKSLASAQESLEAASKQASSMQTEVISVLSIFAGIAFVFSGGMSFLGRRYYIDKQCHQLRTCCFGYPALRSRDVQYDFSHDVSGWTDHKPKYLHPL